MLQDNNLQRVTSRGFSGGAATGDYSFQYKVRCHSNGSVFRVKHLSIHLTAVMQPRVNSATIYCLSWGCTRGLEGRSPARLLRQDLERPPRDTPWPIRPTSPGAPLTAPPPGEHLRRQGAENSSADTALRPRFFARPDGSPIRPEFRLWAMGRVERIRVASPAPDASQRWSTSWRNEAAGLIRA